MSYLNRTIFLIIGGCGQCHQSLGGSGFSHSFIYIIFFGLWLNVETDKCLMVTIVVIHRAISKLLGEIATL